MNALRPNNWEPGTPKTPPLDPCPPVMRPDGVFAAKTASWNRLFYVKLGLTSTCNLNVHASFGHGRTLPVTSGRLRSLPVTQSRLRLPWSQPVLLQESQTAGLLFVTMNQRRSTPAPVGAQDHSPRREPWVCAPSTSSPGWGDRLSFRPIPSEQGSLAARTKPSALLPG